MQPLFMRTTDCIIDKRLSIQEKLNQVTTNKSPELQQLQFHITQIRKLTISQSNALSWWTTQLKVRKGSDNRFHWLSYKTWSNKQKQITLSLLVQNRISVPVHCRSMEAVRHKKTNKKRISKGALTGDKIKVVQWNQINYIFPTNTISSLSNRKLTEAKR